MTTCARVVLDARHAADARRDRSRSPDTTPRRNRGSSISIALPVAARRARRTPSRAGGRRASTRARAAAGRCRARACRRAAPRRPRRSPRRFATTAAMRSLSFTRSSAAPVITVSPSARAARHASSGSSSIIDGTSALADRRCRERDAVASRRRRAVHSPPSSRRFSSRTIAPMRASSARKPVRVSLTHTFSSRSSPPSASAASAGEERRGRRIARHLRVERREVDDAPSSDTVGPVDANVAPRARSIRSV